MRYKDWLVEKAARHVIDDELKEGTGGLIALDAHGNIAMHFN